MAGNIRQDFFVDGGSVDGAAGTRVSGCQFVTPARTGAGVYTLTFGAGQGIDAASSVILVTPRAGTNSLGGCVHTSDIVKTVSTFLANTGVATDTDFDFVILRPGVAA